MSMPPSFTYLLNNISISSKLFLFVSGIPKMENRAPTKAQPLKKKKQ